MLRAGGTAYMIISFKPSRNCPLVSHLQFADDMLILYMVELEKVQKHQSYFVVF